MLGALLIGPGGQAQAATRYDSAHLVSIQQTLNSTLNTPGTNWGIDAQAGRIEVHADQTVSEADYQALSRAIARYGNAVHLQRDPGKLQTAATVINGGDFITSGGWGCTYGFSVEKKTDPSVKGFLTAGHCTVDATNDGASAWYNSSGNYLGDTTGGFFPGNDFGLVNSRGSVSYVGNVNDGITGGVQDITYSRDAKIGEYVCSFGAYSHYGCGTVVQNAWTADYPAGKVFGLDEVDGICRTEGDSGGPLYDDTAALGLLSGTASTDNCFSFYQPVNEALSWYGMEVY
ncbi:S1 family peptidase [Actinacidiphila rubida]|uniref:S1 family peptidase n=1 Tax=Actinacidiphila rubida TaxID=310780 RepID=UPI0008497864|nr:S1 family peptidase [Actinacidiphila rubida]